MTVLPRVSFIDSMNDIDMPFGDPSLILLEPNKRKIYLPASPIKLKEIENQLTAHTSFSQNVVKFGFV